MAEDKKIEDLKKYIIQAEESLEAAKQALFEITGEELKSSQTSMPSPAILKVAADGKVIEGIFNGENMVGPEGKTFPVPANYASKSKLIQGDRLKLSVAEDGSFIFKQIGPAERKKITGELIFSDNMYQVKTEDRTYHLLYAAATFHKAKPGDKVTIVIPASGDSDWAALENIIHDVTPTEATQSAADGVLNLEIPNQSDKQTQTEVENFFGQTVAPAQPIIPENVPTPSEPDSAVKIETPQLELSSQGTDPNDLQI